MQAVDSIATILFIYLFFMYGYLFLKDMKESI